MTPKYYNKWEFDQATSLLEIAPLEAKTKYEQYIEEYPYDYLVYPYYASCLITLGDFSKAEQILEYVEKESKKSSHFKSEPIKTKILFHQIFCNKIRILSYQERYEELYYQCMLHQDLLKEMDMNAVDFYCRQKMGKLDVEKREGNSYLFRQMVSYQEEDFLRHIKKHMADYNNNVEVPNESIFAPNFPITEAIEEVKKYLLTYIRIFPAYYVDTYMFKYDCCGKDNGKTVDFFKVVCLHNTKEFITMCPSSKGHGIPYVDLNYLAPVYNQPKVKRLSQIEKFNKKYK